MKPSTCSDRGVAAASDHATWTLAAEVGAAILTKDEDFARRRISEDDGPVIVWVRLPNTRRRDLLVWFERVLPDIEHAIARGETLIEII